MVSLFSYARNCISDSTENPYELKQATFRAFLDKARNPLCESLTCTPDPHFVKVLNTRCPQGRWRGTLVCPQHCSITGNLLEAVTTEGACIWRGQILIAENRHCPIRRRTNTLSHPVHQSSLEGQACSGCIIVCCEWVAADVLDMQQRSSCLIPIERFGHPLIRINAGDDNHQRVAFRPITPRHNFLNVHIKCEAENFREQFFTCKPAALPW